MNEIILRDEIMTLLADRNDRAALERVYALLKPYFEKKEGTKPKRQLVLTEWQQECIDRAIGKGLIERLPDGTLHWLNSQVLLAYFCGRVFSGDRTCTDDVDGKRYWKCGMGRFPAVALERLFCVENLKQARNRRLNFSSPKKHELVDEIIRV